MELRALGVQTLVPFSPANVTRVSFRQLNRVIGPLVRHGALSPLAVGGGLVILETTGRVSGLPREVPLVASRIGDRVLVSTVRSNSQWIRNVEADAHVQVWVGGRRRDAVAEVCRGRWNVVQLTLI